MMMEFWFIAALLIAIAVMLAVWPLIKSRGYIAGEVISEEAANIAGYRDQIADIDWQVDQELIALAEADKLKLELKKKLADELGDITTPVPHSQLKKPGLALLVALVIPLLVIPLYYKLGATTELAVIDVMKQGGHSSEQIEKVLENWVAKRPQSNQALFMLGSHYLRSGQLDRAVATYRQLVTVSNSHPQATAELAQVLFLNSDNTVTPEVRQLYQQTLVKDSQNTTAMGLQGIDAFANGAYGEAIAVWQQALSLELDPAARQSLSAGINKARTILGDEVVALRVLIDLAPEMGNIPADARIIVFARPAGQEAVPPVAAVPLSVGDLPREIVLDDNSAMMMGGQLLSSLEQLDITARLTLSGDVMSADYQVQAKGVKTSAAEPVRLTFTPAS